MGKSHLVAAAEVKEAKFVSRARVVAQPGDGSCLFHSVAFGLRDGSTARSLRQEVASVIERNPSYRILDTPLSDWIRMDKNVGVRSYVESLRGGAWGGGIELAILSQTRRTTIEVYEARQGSLDQLTDVLLSGLLYF